MSHQAHVEVDPSQQLRRHHNRVERRLAETGLKSAKCAMTLAAALA